MFEQWKEILLTVHAYSIYLMVFKILSTSSKVFGLLLTGKRWHIVNFGLNSGLSIGAEFISGNGFLIRVLNHDFADTGKVFEEGGNLGAEIYQEPLLLQQRFIKPQGNGGLFHQ